MTYVEELGELGECEVGHLGVKCADLDIRFLDNKFLFSEALSRHQVSELIQLSFKLFSS